MGYYSRRSADTMQGGKLSLHICILSQKFYTDSRCRNGEQLVFNIRRTNVYPVIRLGTAITSTPIMVLYPDVRAKGIEEIHRATVRDNHHLLHVNAIIEELYRQSVVIPLILLRTNTGTHVNRATNGIDQAEGMFESLPPYAYLEQHAYSSEPVGIRVKDNKIPPKDFVSDRFMSPHV
ncbi:hypothetical protein BV22DRAFT_920080 [Leucogyrophana mollusca]|uniref:Uncharacterized protein n=1 Tax=Leucogyrophana mollusca TaxID=85980 RepID=A0ACB8B008_9AGAM|nr:hypothetical protein BV22DRAFT_920080 [Leucogyrophana mollusca]